MAQARVRGPIVPLPVAGEDGGMCGRFVVSDTTANELATLIEGLGDLRPSYNVAPTDDVAVVRERHGQRQMPGVRWGFVPSWYPDLRKKPQPINARIENVATSGMFRKAFAQARCLVPADGYYEWVLEQDGGKQPYFIHDPAGAITMAGIISAWPDPAKDENDPAKWTLSMAIITRDAHVAPGEVHDRMPVCLTPESYNDWLGGHLDAEELLKLLDRSSLEVAHRLEAYQVSKDANSVKNNGPHLIEPLR